MKNILIAVLFLSASAFAQHKVALSWAPVTPPAGKSITVYNVYRATVSGGQVIGTHPIDPVGIAATSFIDTTVADGQTYYYKVTTYCPACTTPESKFSSEAQAIIPVTTVPSQPDAPNTITIIIQPAP